jgi:hypothetical protein
MSAPEVDCPGPTPLASRTLDPATDEPLGTSGMLVPAGISIPLRHYGMLSAFNAGRLRPPQVNLFTQNIYKQKNKKDINKKKDMKKGKDEERSRQISRIQTIDDRIQDPDDTTKVPDGEDQDD